MHLMLFQLCTAAGRAVYFYMLHCEERHCSDKSAKILHFDSDSCIKKLQTSMLVGLALMTVFLERSILPAA